VNNPRFWISFFRVEKYFQSSFAERFGIYLMRAYFYSFAANNILSKICLLHRVQTDSMIHPASYSPGNGQRVSFTGDKAVEAWSWPLTSPAQQGNISWEPPPRDHNNQDGSVTIVTRLRNVRPENRGRFPAKAQIFLFSTVSIYLGSTYYSNGHWNLIFWD
jgi:hypothetical protein